MGTSPWDANEGKYDVPTSSVPKPSSQQSKPQLDYVAQRLADARRAGVVPVGADTIIERIEAAAAALAADGLGQASHIYLTDADMLGFRQHFTIDQYNDLPVRPGSASRVYSRSGKSRAVRRPKKVRS